MFNYTQHENSLYDWLTQALGSNKCTLLKANDDAGNRGCKFPLWKGFNNPEINNWKIEDFKKQLDWAKSKNIEVVGYGIVNGSMSNNRHEIDFDADAEKWASTIALRVKAETGVDLWELPRIKTGRTSTGFRFAFRTTESIRDCPLANDKDGNVIAELIGDKVHSVGPGSLHKSGNLYVLENGDWFNPPVIDITLAHKVLEVIRSFDLKPAKKPTLKEVKQVEKEVKNISEPSEWKDIADKFDSDNSIVSILESHGYTDAGNGWYLYPHEKTASVKLYGIGSYHFGTGDPLHGLGYGDGNYFTPFKAEMQLRYGGDFKAMMDTINPPQERNRSLEEVMRAIEEWKQNRVKTEEKPGKIKTEDFVFDLNRLPKPLVQGIAGLAARNPSLSVGYLVLLPFVFAGTLIGKRKSLNNEDNIYYPNLWACILANSSSNKSGTHNAIYHALPRQNKVGNSPTCEALLEELGKSITTKGKSRADILSEEIKFEEESIADLEGRIMITDEITGTLKTMIGDKLGNIDNVLNLATSAKDITMPRIGSGKRVVYDSCFSLIGFTQPTAWNTAFDNDEFKDKGFTGRILPCVKMKVKIADGNRNDWEVFVGATKELCKNLDGKKVDADPYDRSSAWEIEATKGVRLPHPLCHVWVDEALPSLVKLPVYKALSELVGTYIHKLKGKIIGHALKIGMICELFEGTAEGHFPMAFDLITTAFYEYFFQTMTEEAGFTSQETGALVYIKHNPGCRLRDVQRKFNLKDAKETWNLIGRLQERDMIIATENRKGSWVLSIV